MTYNNIGLKDYFHYVIYPVANYKSYSSRRISFTFFKNRQTAKEKKINNFTYLQPPRNTPRDIP